jgi:hypothetical protein
VNTERENAGQENVDGLVLKSDAGLISAGPKKISAVTKEDQRAIFLAHMAGRSIKAGGK